MKIRMVNHEDGFVPELQIVRYRSQKVVRILAGVVPTRYAGTQILVKKTYHFRGTPREECNGSYAEFPYRNPVSEAAGPWPFRSRKAIGGIT
jgi:hypothetical protein